MTRAADLWLAIALNPRRNDMDRQLAWAAFEKESWFEAAQYRHLRLFALERKFQQPVYAMVVSRYLVAA